MTDPITNERLKHVMETLNNLYAELGKRVVYGHSLVGQNDGISNVETILLENAQAHIRESAVSIGRIILNRVGDV